MGSSPLVERPPAKTTVRGRWGLAIRIASFVLLILLAVLAYGVLSTPAEWTELDPVFVLDTPLNSAGTARSYEDPLLYTYENPVLHIAGTIQPVRDERSPALLGPEIVIRLQVEGGQTFEKRVPHEPGPYSFDVDLTGLADGKHAVRIFEQGVAGWRTWRTRPFEFDIDFMTTPLQPPLIVWLYKYKEPDIYEIVGMVRPRAEVVIRGADQFKLRFPDLTPVPSLPPANAQVGKPDFFTIRNSGPPAGGMAYFAGLLRPRPGEAITINSRLESLARESSAPVEIQPGKLEEFAAGLKGLMGSRVTLSLSPRGISSDVTTTVPSDNFLFQQLMGGQASTPVFLNTALGDVSINGLRISSAYNDVLPQISAENGTATVDARSSQDWLFPLRPLGESNLVVSYEPGQFSQAIGRLDELQLSLGDYELLSSVPPATSIADNTYTWKGLQRGAEIQVRVRRNRLAQMLGISSWSIFDFVGGHYWIAYGITFLLELLIASVVFWLMWVNSRVKARQELSGKINALLLGAGVIFLAPSLYYPLEYVTDNLRSNQLIARGILAPLQQLLGPIFLSARQVDTVLQMLMRLALLAAVLAALRYLAWLLGRDSRFTRQVLRVILRLGLVVALIELGMLLLAVVFEPLADAPGTFYIRWMLEALLLAAFGMQVLQDTRDLIRARQPGEAPVKPQFLTEVLTWLVALPLALVLTARTPQEFSFDFSSIQRGVLDALSALRGGAIYYSALGAMMLAVRLQGTGAWKWEGGQKQRARPTAGVLRLQKEGWSYRERQWIWLGKILFAGYLAGVTNTILWVPVVAILGVLVFPRLLNSQERLGQLAFYADRVFAQRAALLGQLADELALNRLRSRVQQLLVGLSGGKMTPSEYDQSVTVLQGEMEHIEQRRTVKDISADDYVLAYGPEKRPLDNAFLGARWALVLQLPLLIVLFRPTLLDQERYPGLYFLVGAFVFIMRWVVTGFFFGLFYEYLQGNNGIRKALTLTIGVLVCTLPYRILRALPSPGAFPVVVLEAGLTAAFLVTLGALFDSETLRRHRFGISYMRVVMNDFTSLAYVSSLLVPIVTVLIPALVTGQLGKILSAIVQGLLPVITSTPGIGGK